MRRRDLLIVVAVSVVLAIGGAYVAYRIMRHAVKQTTAAIFKPHEEVVDLSVLVTRVRNLNRLETASMRVMQVSTITQSYKMVPDSLGSDQITFLAAGDVIAGVDLARLRQQDVWREPDGTVVIRLPPAQVLVSRVDNRESRVMSRKTGVLRRQDINLESRARQHAEQAIRNEAVNKGLLNLANENAERRIAELVHTLGFTKIRFEQSPAAPAPR